MRQFHGLASAFVIVATSALFGCSGSGGPAGPAGPAGDKGDKGDPGAGTPSISAVTPTEAYLARTIDVTISGSGTSWADKATVDFGPNITVNKVTAASTSGIVANITIDKAAAVGPRDVTVKDDVGGSEMFKGAFDIESPLKLGLEGTIAQGSVAFIHARGLDFDTPFDTTSTDGSTFDYINVASPMGITAQVNNVTDYVVDYALLLDVKAAAGDQDVDIMSGPKVDQVEFPSPTAYKVAARTPKDIKSGTTEKGTISSAYETSLYAYTPAAGFHFLQIKADSNDQSATPKAVLLPKSGSFADLIGYRSKQGIGTSTTDPYYMIYFDNTGYSAYDFTLDVVDNVAADGGKETEPNNDMMTATVPTKLPYVILGATLSDADQDPNNVVPLADWYAVTVTAADVAAGKKIHVLTGGDSLTDTVVDIIMPDGMTPFGEPSDDFDYGEELLSDALPMAGTYFVRVYDSFFLDPSHIKYDAFIELK